MIKSKDLAILFHDTYERLAPSFGYETRPDTKAFNPESANGKLMIAVCEEILSQFPSQGLREEEKERGHSTNPAVKEKTYKEAKEFYSQKGNVPIMPNPPKPMKPISTPDGSQGLREALEEIKNISDSYPQYNPAIARIKYIATEALKK